jgi:hypothetical protein
LDECLYPAITTFKLVCSPYLVFGGNVATSSRFRWTKKHFLYGGYATTLPSDFGKRSYLLDKVARKQPDRLGEVEPRLISSAFVCFSQLAAPP